MLRPISANSYTSFEFRNHILKPLIWGKYQETKGPIGLIDTRMFATVLVTVPDLKTAESIAGELIIRKLVACANYFPTRSIYCWKGGTERSEEFILLLKIRSSDFEEIISAVTKMHPYEVPCIVRYDISAGFTPYLDWIRESTDRSPRD